MGIVCGVLMFLAGMLSGAFAMGLVQSKRVFEVEQLRIELEKRLKDSDRDWDVPNDNPEGDRFHEVKVINEKLEA